MYKITDEFIKKVYKLIRKRIKYADLIGKPASLPANGGNADTVDGFHASQNCVANGIVVRDAEKYIQLDTQNDEVSGNQIITTNGTDNKLRKISVERLRQITGLNYVRSPGIIFINAYMLGTGYTKIMQFNPVGWTGGPVQLYVSVRGGIFRKCIIFFTDSSTPSLDIFKMTPTFHKHSCSYTPTDGSLYLVKTATNNIWEMYLASNLNGSYVIWGIMPTISVNNVTFSYGDATVTSLPTGYISPTEVASIP